MFFLFQKQGAYSAKDIVPAWEKVLGRENIVMLDDPDQVVEVIAALIARFEGNLDDDATATAMIAAGGNSATVASAVKALARVPFKGGSSNVIKATGAIDTAGPGADRI